MKDDGMRHHTTRQPRWALTLLVPLAAVALAVTAPARAESPPTGTLKQVAFDQNLDAQLPLDAAFRDEAGRPVRLGDYFVGKKPVILTLVYFRCPLLCGLELQGLARSLKPLTMDVGRQFEIVTISIDPEETPELAAAKKSAYIKRYGRPDAGRGWHFLTGKQDAIGRVARAAGFRYVYDPKSKLFTHASGLVVATPAGKISRYLYGIEYSPRDLQFALMESSAERIGSPVAQVLMFCYDYNAATGKYTIAIVKLVRVLGTATALALAAFMVVMFRRDRIRDRATMAAAVGAPGLGG